MAILVLFSTVSFTVEKHFCGDVLVDVSVFTEAEKCAMEDIEKELETITKKTCCKDTVDVFEGQDELIVKTLDDLEFNKLQFIASYFSSYTTLYESFPKETIPFQYYSPPNLVYDIQVLDQVFII